MVIRFNDLLLEKLNETPNTPTGEDAWAIVDSTLTEFVEGFITEYTGYAKAMAGASSSEGGPDFSAMMDMVKGYAKNYYAMW
jgi:hypothetical protein